MKSFYTLSIIQAVSLLGVGPDRPRSLVLAQSSSGQEYCRYYATSPSPVTYYSCTEMAEKYDITIGTFLRLNPLLDPDCSSMMSNTSYCVAGTLKITSPDGNCGPELPGVTCKGYTGGQCCNSQTWTCGGSEQDCESGTCYEGGCSDGFPLQYSLDGKCGPNYSDKICAGPWGRCCNWSGKCGTGDAYCDETNCESGQCDILTISSPTATGPSVPLPTTIQSPDGTCGNVTAYTCNVVWGECCGVGGICGATSSFCGTGCQSGYGKCTTPSPMPGDVSPDGGCGGTSGFICTGSPFGDCCSSFGYCGSETGHCGTGCQVEFGTCSNSTDMSPDGTCGPASGAQYNCTGSGFGGCCSSSGYCGDTAAHCGSGCQDAFGMCSESSNISTDGTCAANGGGKTCLGSEFGDCCSSGGYCGSSTAYCDAGCQEDFGTCQSGSNVSVDGSCGSANEKSCLRSEFGDCCSSSNYCGATSAFCGYGCQSTYGSCGPLVSTDGSCGSVNGGATCQDSGLGNCCSGYGWCGSTSSHCGAGCQSTFGTCS